MIQWEQDFLVMNPVVSDKLFRLGFFQQLWKNENKIVVKYWE